jgi:hypothetical protein
MAASIKAAASRRHRRENSWRASAWLKQRQPAAAAAGESAKHNQWRK